MITALVTLVTIYLIGYQLPDLGINAHLYMRQTRHELYEALEHRHVADGDQLLPDVEDDLQEGRSVLIPKRSKS